jgi:hypothetical protein
VHQIKAEDGSMLKLKVRHGELGWGGGGGTRRSPSCPHVFVNSCPRIGVRIGVPIMSPPEAADDPVRPRLGRGWRGCLLSGFGPADVLFAVVAGCRLTNCWVAAS